MGNRLWWCPATQCDKKFVKPKQSKEGEGYGEGSLQQGKKEVEEEEEEKEKVEEELEEEVEEELGEELQEELEEVEEELEEELSSTATAEPRNKWKRSWGKYKITLNPVESATLNSRGLKINVTKRGSSKKIIKKKKTAWIFINRPALFSMLCIKGFPQLVFRLHYLCSSSLSLSLFHNLLATKRSSIHFIAKNSREKFNIIMSKYNFR